MSEDNIDRGPAEPFTEDVEQTGDVRVPLSDTVTTAIEQAEGSGEIGDGQDNDSSHTGIETTIRPEEEGTQYGLDVDKKREEAKAEDPVRTMISNVNKSNLSDSDKTEITKKLEEDAKRLSEEAEARYLEIKKQYNNARDTIVGNITAFMSNRGSLDKLVLLNFGDKSTDKLSLEDKGRLRDEVFALLGITEYPSTEELAEYCSLTYENRREYAQTHPGTAMPRYNYGSSVAYETPYGFRLAERLGFTEHEIDDFRMGITLKLDGEVQI